MTKPVSVIERAISILWSLTGAGRSLSLQQIAKACDLPPSSTHRLLKQLQKVGVVAQAPNRLYMVGSDLLFMAAMASSKSPLLRAAEPAIHEIFDRCQKTCILSLYLPEK